MTSESKPQNGLAGLAHWRFDLMAGMQVALVSLPLSLGIAIASGAPPVSGVVSAIIAGLIFPFLGGAYVTISGPAAGLAPALLAGMLLLGDGSLAAGYPLILVAICLTGVIQIILSIFKAGRWVAMFLPVTVVEAMLAAIGLLIIVKQIPALLGVIAEPTKNTLIALTQVPDNFSNMEPTIFLIGGISLFLMFYLNATRIPWLRILPAPLMVCIIGMVLGYALNIDAINRISMPDNILEGGFTLPAFEHVLNQPDLWVSIILIVVTLTLIDGIESLATIAAVDKIDPYRRKSDPNVTLRAMGVSNLCSSLAGGLTIIPGGVKSRTNIDAGGRTLWANFYNASFLIIFLFFAKDLISLIPYASVGAILVYVGWRLCEPKVFAKTYAIGRDQAAIFIITMVAILVSDLLTGIIVGIIAETLMLGYILSPSFQLVLTGRLTTRQLLTSLAYNLMDLFRNPVIKVSTEKSQGRVTHDLSLSTLVGFNLIQLDKVLMPIPKSESVTLTVNESGRIIDHTAMEYLHDYQESSLQQGRAFKLQGIEEFHAFTQHPLSSRMRDATLVREKVEHSTRERAMMKLAEQYKFEFASGPIATLNRHDFVYLRRGENRYERNVMTGSYKDCHVKLFDYSHTAAPDYYSEHRHTLISLRLLDAPSAQLPNFVITPGHYLERYLIEYRQVDTVKMHNSNIRYRVYAKTPAHGQEMLTDFVKQHIRHKPGYYLELRDNVLLVFRPGETIEATDMTPELLSFVELLHHWSKMETITSGT